MVPRKRFLGIATLSLLLAIALVFSVSFAVNSQASAASISKAQISPRFYSFQHQPAAGAFARTNTTPAALATWTSTFQYGGQTYPYTMVGTDPTQGSKTTTIPVTIIPLKVVFGNTVFDGKKQVDAVTDSPLFQKTDFPTGDTEYTDAIQRGSFWSTVQKYSPKYHVLVGKPDIKKTYTLNITTGEGELVQNQAGHIYGNIDDINWWDTQMQALLTRYHSTSNGFTIFLTYDIIIELGIGGYHNSTGLGLPGDITYAWASYYDPFLYDGFSNVGALSHEMAEWTADPYTTNQVPEWSVPDEPQYGCSNALEVGDPLVGVVFKRHGYTLQDETFFSWFSRQSPSIGFKGYYSYLGTFTTYSSSVGC